MFGQIKMNRIIICDRCGVMYNAETIEKCPVCTFHKEQRDFTRQFNSQISELKKCVSLSRKGKHHKNASGMHVVKDLYYYKRNKPCKC